MELLKEEDVMTQHEITKFTIHQFKGVRGTIEISPNGPGCIIIAGPNGAGKSSVVDGMMQIVSKETITEKKGIPKPIHEGKDGAFVEMTTSELTARVTYKKNDGGDLTVTALDGAKYGSPKAFMVKATGGQVFDTAEFETREPKLQRAELLRRVDLPFDVDVLDAKAKGFYDSRTEVGRDVTRLTNQLAGFAPADPSLPSDEIPATTIIAEHAAAVEHNKAIESRERATAELEASIEAKRAELVRIREALDAAETWLANAEPTLIEHLAVVSGLKRIDLAEISARLDSADADNAKIRVQAGRAKIAAELAEKTAEQEGHTANIKQIEAQKKAGLAAAVFPVAGLGIDETGITFDGIPFRQVNAAQRIIVAFDLFTLDKPDLRIIFIKNGDMLDATSLAGIEKIAIERGYYVVIERDRDESRAIGFTVKDGELAA